MLLRHLLSEAKEPEDRMRFIETMEEKCPPMAARLRELWEEMQAAR